METTLGKQALDASSYHRDGYIVLKKFFHHDDVAIVRTEAIQVFTNICEKKQYNGGLLDQMKLLFQLDEKRFVNCGKQCQHLINLWKLSLQRRVIRLLREVGMKFPTVCTRPVLYFNHPALAKEKVYHTVDAHQDWRSMQGSSNACVLWVPLVKMTKEIGALQVLPGSHKDGLRTKEVLKGFGMVELTEDEEKRLVDLECEPGDAVLFHAMLVHRSGWHTNDEIRWSAHFRYNDLEDAEFIKRGYVHPYVYHPVAEIL